MKTVSFRAMIDGTAEEYALLRRYEEAFHRGLADRVLEHLALLKHGLSGYQVSRYEHSLQTATRAQRDGADEETVVCALLHDIGDILAPDDHSRLAAAILRPYVSDRNHWIVAHHGLFQGYYYFHHIGKDRNARERYRDHPYYEDCVRFCERWDQTSFDPGYDTLPIDFFEPMVQRLFKGRTNGTLENTK
jgi:predicted HD phosphohydrolase